MSQGGSGFNEIGYQNAAQWSYTTNDGKTWSLCARTSPKGVGTVIKENLEMKKWYRIKVVYEPSDTTDTCVSYYVDGDLVSRSNTYYNGGVDASLPAKRVERLNFSPFANTEAVMYFDNITMTAQQ